MNILASNFHNSEYISLFSIKNSHLFIFLVIRGFLLTTFMRDKKRLGIQSIQNLFAISISFGNVVGQSISLTAVVFTYAQQLLYNHIPIQPVSLFSVFNQVNLLTFFNEYNSIFKLFELPNLISVQYIKQKIIYILWIYYFLLLYCLYRINILYIGI